MDDDWTPTLVRHVRRLGALQEAEPAAVVQGLTEALTAVLRVEAAHVLIAEPGERTLWVTTTRVTDGVAAHTESVLPAEGAGAGLRALAARREPVVCGPELGDLLPAPLAAGDTISGGLLLPIVAGGAVRGAAVAVGAVPGAQTGFPDVMVDAAAALAGLAGGPFALADARRAARIDPLTGCVNRGALAERMSEEIARSARQRSPLACVLLDLDDFKAVNDDHGHLAGDAVLRQVGAALQRQFRPFDLVARYGGDEFLALLPNASTTEVTLAAARALQAIRSIVPEHGSDGGADVDGAGPPPPLAASAGVAQWRSGESSDAFVARADAALRRGKREGKNRVGHG